ncbi:hypothetical protein BDQ12DRAFT_699326 [Crucibulum laeve]|uniref:P-loop containing nucleoside triphosphate hydrolase protein n=1 Tax=Crucibulum laeve TaxID=68775 RepID=A0A5C3LY25_9AGAR|nr:hypothetical protein BDQ12DRAFT_699326 [Crucibulum laeve]
MSNNHKHVTDASSLLSDTLIIPAYIAIVSSIALILHLIIVSGTVQRLLARALPQTSNLRTSEVNGDPTDAVPSISLLSDVKQHVASHGGQTIFAFKVARLISCLILLAFSIVSAVADENNHIGDQFSGVFGKWGKKHKHSKRRGPSLSVKEWLDLAMCMTYFYASLIALVSVSAKYRWSKVATRHLNALLFVTFAVYFYRDLFPLTTFTRPVLDLSEGKLLVAKISVLFLSGLAIPLLIPRQYIPVDPKNPMATPNPEQTASILSLITYSFLDPIIFLAYRIPHLSHDQLPPLADYDYSHHLVGKSFPHLDTFGKKKKRHLFFGIMRVFYREYLILALMITIQVMASFASPLGINRLLSYLETGGEGAIVKPWLWILWLFVGPTISSFAWQWYIFIATRTMVRAECIITELVFEHALRIRVKAETHGSTSDTTSDSANSTIATENTLRVDEESGSEDGTLHSQGATDASIGHSQEETLQGSSSSIKSSSSKGDKGAKQDEADQSSASNLIGRINNLVTTDLGNIVDSRDFLFVLLYIPLQITLCIIFLYIILGWSAFVGLAVILLLFPAPGYVAKLIQGVQVERMKKTDGRVQTVTETMNVLRMIKLFGWERKMNEKIADKREEELTWIWKRQLLDLVNGNLNYIIPVFTMMATYATYASKVFSSMSIFDMLRDQLHMIFFYLSQAVTGKVSLDRVNDFLHNTELLDSFEQKESLDLQSADVVASGDQIGFRNASFTWSNDADGSLTPSKRNFSLNISGELVFKHGCVNLIIGPTGSGKTSLLMALLGEMHYIPARLDSWFGLPRSYGVAYAAQESWVQNETIKENILFGAAFNEDRYKRVIYECCLERDLELFDAGDQTEVGEKGLTLSGGQKARITLARAIYSQAQTILLDDVLAALDVHTAKWIVEKCFSGDLIKNRTVLLVTHNVALARPVAEFVVVMGKDGRVSSHGTVSEVLKTDPELAKEITEDAEGIQKSEEQIDTPLIAAEERANADGKLILSEEVEEGHVSWSALKLYFVGLGGNHPILFFLAFAIGLTLTELSAAIQTWYLGYWASQYDEQPASSVRVFYYLGVYGILLMSGVTIYCLSYVVYVFGTLRASRTIHKQLLESVLGTTLRWLDVTPTSRVIARCTQDIRAVDGPISSHLWWLSEMTMIMVIKFGAVVLLTPVFLIPGLLVAGLGGWCGQIYIAAQLSVKREMSNAKAPVLGHFGAAIAGLTSIRAYGAQYPFIQESLSRINRYTQAARTFYNLNRWICVRIDAIGGLFAAALATYLVYFQNHSAANTGFSLNMAVGFSGMILWWVRVLNDFEVQGYIDIEQEPKPTPGGIPPAYWPSSGKIQVENLSAKYSMEGPKVLHGLSFDIKSGERIGVVGRTGSGKSSLTLSLLRCIFTEGDVYYDGINTNNVNLDALRSNITIIPQIPELLSGSLRQNLDPFDQYDDAILNDALRSAGLFALQSNMEEGRITLDSSIASGGANLSVGQRQILALARAIVRGSKLLILDEDHTTDAIIQTSLREGLGGDVTLITVAHRLQTIMDADKIMVLDAGRIIEYDTPKELLKKKNGKLRALVDESGDRNALYAMAEGRAMD